MVLGTPWDVWLIAVMEVGQGEAPWEAAQCRVQGGGVQVTACAPGPSWCGSWGNTFMFR